MPNDSRPMAPVSKTVTHFLFASAETKQKTRQPGRTPPLAICYHRELPLATDTFELAISAKQTYCYRMSAESSTAAVHLTPCALDTGAGPNLVIKTLVPRPWTHRIQRGFLPKQLTVTEQPLQVGERYCFTSVLGPSRLEFYSESCLT